MLPTRSEILAEAKNTLTRAFSIVFFLNLNYTLITYDVRKSKNNEQKVTSNEQKIMSDNQRITSNQRKKRAKRNKQKVQPRILRTFGEI